jgi:hypothetical protein
MKASTPDCKYDQQMTRRGIIVGAAALLTCTPAIVRVANLMPVRGIILSIDDPSYPGPQYAGFVERLRYDFLNKALRSGWDDMRHARMAQRLLDHWMI